MDSWGIDYTPLILPPLKMPPEAIVPEKFDECDFFPDVSFVLTPSRRWYGDLQRVRMNASHCFKKAQWCGVSTRHWEA